MIMNEANNEIEMQWGKKMLCKLVKLAILCKECLTWLGLYGLQTESVLEAAERALTVRQEESLLAWHYKKLTLAFSAV